MWRWLAYVVLALVALVILALLALATPPGTALVADAIERSASGSGLTVAIGTPRGWPPFSFGADTVTIADDKGTFAEIDALSLEINVAALITGRVELTSLSADRIAVSRRPELPGGGGSGAALPFAADKVDVARVELGSAVVGRAATLSLTGSLASSRNGGLHAEVAANRTDGGVGSLTATIDRANGSAPFAVDAQAREAANGILVGLLGRTDGPAYSLTAKTAVSGDATNGTLTLASGGAAHFTGSFSFDPAANGAIHIVAKGDGDLAELTPPQYADLIAGPIDLSFDADYTAPAAGHWPTIAVQAGSLTTANVRASLTGSLSDTAADLALKADAAKADGTPLALPFLGPDASAQSLSLTGQVSPKDADVRLDVMGHAVNLKAAGLALPGPDFSLAIEAPRNQIDTSALPFGLRVQADAITTATGTITATANAPIVVDAGGTFDAGTGAATGNAKFAIAGGNGTFDGTASTAGIKGNATAEFADLTALSPLAGRALGGAVSLSLNGALSGPQAAFKLSATATDLDVGQPELKRLLAGETQVTAAIGSKDGGFTADDVSISGKALTASGQAALAGGQVSASLKGTIADLALIADQSSGAADFTATVSGAVARPSVDASIDVASGSLLGKPVSGASIRFTGAPDDSGWHGALQLSGSYAGKPLTSTTQAALDASGQLAFPAVDLAVGDNRITGALVRTPSGLLSGSLDVAANDLATLGALALIPASGKGTAKVSFTPSDSGQTINASFNASGVSYQSLAAGTLTGTVAITNAFGTPLVSGNAKGSAIAVGGLKLDSAAVTASVTNGATQFTGSASNADLNLTGAGSLATANGATAVTLSSLTGTAYKLPVKLGAPVTIALGGSATALHSATLSLGGGTLIADGAVSPTLNLTVALNGVGANVVNGFAPAIGAEGTVTGRATITGSAAAPHFAWQATWTGLRVAATRNAGLPPLSLTASGAGDLRTTSLKANVGGLPGLSLDVNGTVPFSGGGLNITANGTAPLALLALQSSRELRLAGNARVNLALTGSLAAVATNGTIDLDGATVADTDTGFGISGASGRIAFNGHQATTQQISGQLIQGGTITVAGSVTVDAAGLPGNLTVKVNGGRYADGRMISTTFDADLAINGPVLADGTVSGTVNLGRTEIQLPDRLAGSATAIPVTHINAPPGFHPPVLRQQSQASGPAGKTSGGLRLNVTLNGGSAIFVRGFGIDSEFTGSLHLTGTMGNPDTIGAFTMSRGRMQVLGRRFDFQSGTLTFSGDLVPILNFSGTTATTDSTVTLNVTGTANNPQISFSSSPALPEEEILARLLFNQSVGNLSPLQAAQLVDAVAQLTGAVGNGGIFARIREATGLDDLDIRQSATGGTTVGLSKRISDNVEVGVEAGTGGDSSRVTIDLNLTKELKARVEGGQGGTGQVGLTYEHEY